jgi:excisionase family DNA binding protein
MLRVDPKTVSRWAEQGKLPALRTLGGHRRFRRSDLNDALAKANSEVETSL